MGLGGGGVDGRDPDLVIRPRASELLELLRRWVGSVLHLGMRSGGLGVWSGGWRRRLGGREAGRVYIHRVS